MKLRRIKWCQQIAGTELDAISQIEVGKIATRQRDGILGKVGRPDARVRLVSRKRQRKVARSCTNIEHRGMALLAHDRAQLRERSSAQQLGLLTRNKRCIAGKKLHTHELLPTGEVGQRDARDAVP